VSSPHRARRPSRRPLAFFVFAAVVVGTMVLGLTALNAVLAQTSFRLDDLSSRADKLSAEYRQKELQVAQLTSPGRIAREAGALGMQLPQPDAVQVIHVPGTSVRPGGEPRPLPNDDTRPVVGGEG
jgi:cell division protein FtsL